MHPIQKKILLLISSKPLAGLSMRQIGFMVGVDHPQLIKHHIEQLEKKGLIKYDKINKTLTSLQSGQSDSTLLSLPIYGAANCGEATHFADNYIEGYLKVSKNLLKKTRDVIILEASGDSMNAAKINGQQNIEDGDYVVVDTEYRNPQNGDYVVSIIDGMANIKKFFFDRENHQIALVSESTKKYSPIFISPDEAENYSVSGKVIQVIKKPNI